MNIPKEEDANAATRVYGIYFSLKLESPLFRMLGEELADETRETENRHKRDSLN